VYLAQQTEPVRRAVAVKVIKAGMDSKAVLARFEAERQALALMDHPNIAKVLDAGTTDGGRPFFVMELVKGTPITQFCDERRLTPRERLELFVPVCQAVQHAHQKGVIHRDLKPSNVLVALYDDRPTPKVIDFGVAKAAGQTLTEKTLMTGFGAVVGTPEYMSPEQASMNNLDIDTRSDVYSLGVLLYELLTGATPVDRKRLGKAALLEILRIVREVEAPRPSAKLSTSDTLPSVAACRGTESGKLSKLMRGELDWVVLKALEKDRTRRYETANALGRDIQRYLADEVVEARPPSTAYRLKKFVRRHKGQVLVAGLVLFVLLAGMAGTTWQALRAEQARADEASQRAAAEENERRANAAADGERRAKLDAQEKEKLALAAADKERAARREEERQRQFAEAISRFVRDNFLALTSVEGQDRFGGAGKEALSKDTTLRELLDRAAAKLRACNDLDPRTEAELCWIVGVNYRAVGEATKAIGFLERAVQLRSDLLGRDHAATLNAMDSLAVAYSAGGKWDLALPLSEESLKLHKAKLGPEHPDTLISSRNLALAYLHAGKVDLALALCEEALKLSKATLGPEHLETLRGMNCLAAAYRAAGKYDLALPLLEESLKLHKARLGPEHHYTLRTMGMVAVAYQEAGKPDLALPLLEETLRLTKAKLGPDHPDTLRSMNNLAGAYQEAGKLNLALPLLEEALKLHKARLGPEHAHTLKNMNNLAVAYQADGKRDLALPLFEETLRLRKARLGPDHPDTLRSMGDLAVAYQDVGKPDLALPLFEEALRLTKAKLGPDHPDTLRSMNRLAVSYWKMKHLDKSIPLFEDLLKRYKAKLGRDHPDTVNSVANLGVNYNDAGRLKEAIALLEEAHQGTKKSPALRRVGTTLLDAYAKAGEDARFAALLQEHLSEARQALGKDSPQLAGMLAQISLGLLGQKKWAEAEPLLRECLAIREKTQPDAWTTFDTRSQLGGALLGQKKYADAEPLLVAGYEGMKKQGEKIPAQGKVRLPEALDRLIELYTATNKPDEVKKWQAERAKYKEIAPPPLEK
jgi:hypothetical protein